MDLFNASFANPKVGPAGQWFHYYAGFSAEFVDSVFDAFEMPQGATLLDPWLGGGTTALRAIRRGLNAVGLELSPAMALISRARIYATDACAIEEAGDHLSAILPIVSGASSSRQAELGSWIGVNSATLVHALVATLSRLPVGEREVSHQDWASRLPELTRNETILIAASLAAIRTATRGYRGSNPTWPKRPSEAVELAGDKPKLEALIRTALAGLKTSTRASLADVPKGLEQRWAVSVGSSTSIPYTGSQFDAVVTSPPYCTRIDYCKKTQIELSSLGIHGKALRELRNRMIGTPTIDQQLGSWRASSKDVRDLLRAIEKHDSYAAKQYYYKFYKQYFLLMQASIEEISRTLRKGGRAAIVVQTSHFKNLLIDLPSLTVAMAEASGLQHQQTMSWQCTSNLVHINTRAREYLKTRSDQESVVVLSKQV